MKLIALTGGIAAGKSTIGRRLEELGATRIDADRLARDAVAAGSPGLLRVRERFGDGVLLADGSLDREALGEVVFADAAALADLNAIVHPEVRRLFDERVAAVAARDPDAVVVYEIPLLAETGPASHPAWDLVVTAEAPVETRIARMVEQRGMSEAEAGRRIGHQASEAERRRLADVIVDTGGAQAETLAQADALWERIRGA